MFKKGERVLIQKHYEGIVMGKYNDGAYQVRVYHKDGQIKADLSMNICELQSLK